MITRRSLVGLTAPPKPTSDAENYAQEHQREIANLAMDIRQML